MACEIIPFAGPGFDRQGLDPTGLGPQFAGGAVAAEIDAEILAGRLNHLCAVRGIRVLLLDGPQAWKSRANGLEHARGCERQLNTAAKTGLPGMVKPITYRSFAEFCMDVYDALCRRGWRRLQASDQPGFVSTAHFSRKLSLRGLEVAGIEAAARKAAGQGE